MQQPAGSSQAPRRIVLAIVGIAAFFGIVILISNIMGTARDQGVGTASETAIAQRYTETAVAKGTDAMLTGVQREGTAAAKMSTEVASYKPVQPSGPGAVSRDSLGVDWPFTVDSGTVACRGASEVVFTSGGVTYAVNGTARQTGQYAEVDAIWASDPAIPGAKIDISPIIEAGLELCE